MRPPVLSASRSRLGRICGLLGCTLLGFNAHADPTFSPGVPVGNVNTSLISESSGLAASQGSAGVLWTHNDSGDSARLFALDLQARLLGEYLLPGVSAIDFEDIAVGPGPEPGVRYIYIGDIGDNAAARPSITVHRVPDPAVYLRQYAAPVAGDLKGAVSITLHYPDSPHNAESLFIDPMTGDLFIATKQSGSTSIYRADAADLSVGGPVTLSFVRSLNLDFGFQLTTAGDISKCGNEIILKGYTFARLYLRDPGETVGEALGGTGINIPFVLEAQGEALAYDEIGQDYYTLSEGSNQPLYLYERTSDDGPAPPTALVAAGETWRFLDDGTDQGHAWREMDFNDDSWASGEGQLGYGDGDEFTIVRFGDDPNDKHVTTYFRRDFTVSDATAFGSLQLRLLVDDGAAVYLNGIEVWRKDLAPDADHADFASDAQEDLEDTWRVHAIGSAALISGANTLAVEMHQAAPDDPDLSFDLQLLGLLRQPTGDLNDDGCVNQQDLGILLASYELDPGGDVDGDGDTDQSDLGILLANFDNCI